MNSIYLLDMTVSFLLQAARVLNVGNYDDDELSMIYRYIMEIDKSILVDYSQRCTVLSYTNDLHLLVEIINAMIYIYEEREEYEICGDLKNKIEECNKIINSQKN